MSPEDRVIAIGELMPEIRLQTAGGGELTTSSLRGRPLLAVCVRYYG